MSQHKKKNTDHKNFYDASESFIRENSIFESSMVIKEVCASIKKTVNINEVFKIPLQYKIFNLEGTLRWLLFLYHAPCWAQRKGDKTFSECLNLSIALSLTVQVYDLGVKEVVETHFEDEEDDEEEDNEKDSDEE